MSTKAPLRRDTPASASPPEPTLGQGTEHENVAGFIGNAVPGEQPTTALALRSVLEQISERLPPQTHPEIIARMDKMSILREDKAALVSILMEHGAPPDQPEFNENDPAAVPARKNRHKEIFTQIVDGLFAATAAEMVGERRKGWELSRARQCFRDGHERGWMLFAERYGKVRGVVYKTVNRWRLNFEQEVAAPNPPLAVIAEVTAQGYDLTNKKHKPLLSKLRRIPRELAEVKPKETVEQAIRAVREDEAKVAKRKGLLAKDRRLLNLCRMVRPLLDGVQEKEDLDLVWDAFGMELHALGFTDVLQITIIPRPQTVVLGREGVGAEPLDVSAELDESPQPTMPTQNIEESGYSVLDVAEPELCQPGPIALHGAKSSLDAEDASEPPEPYTALPAEPKDFADGLSKNAVDDVSVIDSGKWNADYTALTLGTATPYWRKVIEKDWLAHLHTGRATEEQIKQCMAMFAGGNPKSVGPSTAYRDLGSTYPQYCLANECYRETDEDQAAEAPE
jgi:hypothetical protein